MPPPASRPPAFQSSTRLLSGKRVSKTMPLVVLIGTLDELGSCLGVALSATQRVDTRKQVRLLQQELSQLSAHLSSEGSRRFPWPRGRWSALERRNLRLSQHTAIPRKFLCPGLNQAEAMLHLARAVSRRAECQAWAVSETRGFPGAEVGAWLNRLSHTLFLLACREYRTIPGRGR